MFLGEEGVGEEGFLVLKLSVLVVLCKVREMIRVERVVLVIVNFFGVSVGGFICISCFSVYNNSIL